MAEIYRGYITELNDGFEDLKVLYISCDEYCGKPASKDYTVVVSVDEEIAAMFAVGDTVKVMVEKIPEQAKD